MPAAEWHVAMLWYNRWAEVAETLAALASVAEVLTPFRIEKHTVRGRTVERRMPWLGPLALARWETDDPHAWHDVADVIRQKCPGSGAGIVGGWPPAVVPQHQVDRLLREIDAIEGKVQPTEPPPCAAGEIVRFTHLAFYRLIARCVWVSDIQVGLRLQLLGRDVVVPVPWAAVERQAEQRPRIPQFGKRNKTALQASDEGLRHSTRRVRWTDWHLCRCGFPREPREDPSPGLTGLAIRVSSLRYPGFPGLGRFVFA